MKRNLLIITVIFIMVSTAFISCTEYQQPSNSIQEPSVTQSTAETGMSETTPVSAVQGQYNIVDTNQSKCYNNTRTITCPQPGEAFYGQDAQYKGLQPSYQDNGDGTITDLNTGLMWQQDPGDKMSYSDAVSGAESFSLAGYDDWRLPTIKELYSLILFSGTDPSGPDSSVSAIPFIDTDYFLFEYGDTSTGDRIIDSQFISSTNYVGTVMGGRNCNFGVNFADGRIKGYPVDPNPNQPVSKLFFVLYVRGNPDYGINDFEDNGDGTIRDTATNLMWSQSDSGEGMNWEEALAWVQQKNEENYLGYSDWRLPNAKELQSIVDYSRSPDTTNSAAIDPVFKTTSITNADGQTDYPYFWTGTTHVNANAAVGGQTAAYVAFGRAMGYMQFSQGRMVMRQDGPQSPQQSDGNYEYMDVHGAGAQRSDPKSGDASAYPVGHGPQGDEIRIDNYVRLVRDAS